MPVDVGGGRLRHRGGGGLGHGTGETHRGEGGGRPKGRGVWENPSGKAFPLIGRCAGISQRRRGLNPGYLNSRPLSLPPISAGLTPSLFPLWPPGPPSNRVVGANNSRVLGRSPSLAAISAESRGVVAIRLCARQKLSRRRMGVFWTPVSD
jgi:hypothetical protein